MQPGNLVEMRNLDKKKLLLIFFQGLHDGLERVWNICPCLPQQILNLEGELYKCNYWLLNWFWKSFKIANGIGNWDRWDFGTIFRELKYSVKNAIVLP